MKLVLKERRYLVESREPEALRALLQGSPEIARARLPHRTQGGSHGASGSSAGSGAGGVGVGKTEFLESRPLGLGDEEADLASLLSVGRRYLEALDGDIGGERGMAGDLDEAETEDSAQVGVEGEAKDEAKGEAKGENTTRFSSDARGDDVGLRRPQPHPPGAAPDVRPNLNSTVAYSFEVSAEEVEGVKREAQALGFPLLEEYDW